MHMQHRVILRRNEGSRPIAWRFLAALRMTLNVAGSTDMRYATDISRTFGVLALGAMFLGGEFCFGQNGAGDHAGTEKANATPPDRTGTITGDDMAGKKSPVAPPPLPVSLADQPSYVEDMRHLLEVGLDLRNGDLESAKRYFDANICRGEDPRLCYAWALVCLKRLQYDQALEALSLRHG